MDTSVQTLRRRLEDVIRPYGRLLTAYSGGVDSTLVAAVARRVLGREAAPAAIGDSASLPRRELAEARALAERLDLELIEINPGEQADPNYQANDGHRCFHCKQHLYAALRPAAAARGIDRIANGTNTDDPGDHRPGLDAAAQAGIVSPLLEAGLDKAQVRALAEALGLPNADKPAAACLASRIAYGTRVTAENLSRVERAEDALHVMGFRGFRVRDHETVARLELAEADLARAVEGDTRRRIVDALREVGYAYVSLDLAGFRSGSGNAVLGPTGTISD